MNRPFHILISEDNQADQVLIKRGFNGVDVPLQIHFVENGMQATGFLNRSGEFAEAPRPDLIILDLNMARKDGKEVLSEIKQDDKFRSIPVVVFTTSNAKLDVNDCYNLGANVYLTKPSDLSGFLDMIQAIATFWLRKATLSTPMG